MKNVVLSILGFILIVTAVAQPAEAASRKSKPVAMRSERSRDAFAMSPSAAIAGPAVYAAPDIERLRNEALSPPAGR